MGEVLQGPWSGRSGEEGVGRRPAPSRRTAEDGTRVGVAVDAPDQPGEPRWAVPGVDDAADTAPAPEPAPRSKRAENVAMAALTRHDASEGEVRAKLVAKGLEQSEIDGELDRLRGAGLLDDAEFATRLVDRLRERKGLGDSAIRSTLRGRLVPPAIVDAVLAERAEDRDALEERVQEVAHDRARRRGTLPYAVAERRLTAYLMRKGYSGSAVRDATRNALEAVGIR